MSDPGTGGDGGNESQKTGDEARLAARLEALGDKLESHRAEIEPPGPNTGPASAAGQGLAVRLTAEFVAGILVGGAIGWFLDGWLGTSPWGLIVFPSAARSRRAQRVAHGRCRIPARRPPGNA
jgi:ATP synthase protein I